MSEAKKKKEKLKKLLLLLLLLFSVRSAEKSLFVRAGGGDDSW